VTTLRSGTYLSVRGRRCRTRFLPAPPLSR
jgi:hypothetical protein